MSQETPQTITISWDELVELAQQAADRATSSADLVAYEGGKRAALDVLEGLGVDTENPRLVAADLRFARKARETHESVTSKAIAATVVLIVGVIGSVLAAGIFSMIHGKGSHR